MMNPAKSNLSKSNFDVKFKYTVSETISIAIGGAVGLSCVVSEMIHATVDRETEKAIRINIKGDSIWLPKKALESKSDWFKLKKWFRPDQKQLKFFDKYSSIGGVSAQ